MKVKALISFGGVVSMTKGEIRKISKTVAKDLIKAGYVEQVVEEKEEKPKKTTKTSKKTVKTDEKEEKVTKKEEKQKKTSKK